MSVRSRLSERRAGRFDLAHQHIGAVDELVAPLEEPLGGLARDSNSLPQLFREDLAISEVRTDALREVSTTVRAPVAVDTVEVRADLFLAEAPITRIALGNVVIPAIDVEEYPLLGSQTAGAVAVDMPHGETIRGDRLARYDQLAASWASLRGHVQYHRGPKPYHT